MPPRRLNDGPPPMKRRLPTSRPSWVEVAAEEVVVEVVVVVPTQPPKRLPRRPPKRPPKRPKKGSLRRY